MGDVGEEAPTLLLAGGELRRHLVEGGGEQPQLLRSAHRDIDIAVFARGDLFGGVQQVADWSADPPVRRGGRQSRGGHCDADHEEAPGAPLVVGRQAHVAEPPGGHTDREGQHDRPRHHEHDRCEPQASAELLRGAALGHHQLLRSPSAKR